MEPRTVPRVVINERTGTIVISGDVEIGSVAVTHKNLIIEAGGQTAARPFVGVDPVDPTSPKLKALVEALNAVHAPDRRHYRNHQGPGPRRQAARPVDHRVTKAVHP